MTPDMHTEVAFVRGWRVMGKSTRQCASCGPLTSSDLREDHPGPSDPAATTREADIDHDRDQTDPPSQRICPRKAFIWPSASRMLSISPSRSVGFLSAQALNAEASWSTVAVPF